MASTLRVRFEDLHSARSELNFHRKKLAFLEEFPDNLAGNKFYRFATFTAVSGSAVAEQVVEFSHPPHDEPGGVARNAAKGASKLPKINERALLKRVKRDSDVPKGMIRQYFCYADARGMGNIVITIEIPSEHKEFAKIRRVRIPNHEMLHFQFFDTTSLQNYVVHLEEYYKSVISHSSGSIRKALVRNQRFQDIKINSGFTVVGGPEALFQSATMSGSRGGFLVQLINEFPELLYCPDCATKALETYASSNGGTASGIVFPPIPEIAFSSNVLCTENVHMDHSMDDCLRLDQILSKIAAIRKESGQGEFDIFNITIPSKSLSPSHGELVWMGI